MFCIKCGKEQPSGAMYCPFCGAKQTEEFSSELVLAPTANSAEGHVSLGNGSLPSLDFPVSDLEPIYINTPWCATWMFRYKVGSPPPPQWTSSAVDIMFSETHIFIQPQITKKATLADYLQAAGTVTWAVTGAVASFVAPVVALGLATPVLVADQLTKKKKNHPGYGECNQFTRDTLIAMFSAGQGMWAARSECEFRALRAWRFGNPLEKPHFFAIIGKFHHISGVYEYAAFLDVGYLADDFKKELVSKTGCVISRDDQFKVRSEALRSLEGFSEPQITKDLDH